MVDVLIRFMIFEFFVIEESCELELNVAAKIRCQFAECNQVVASYGKWLVKLGNGQLN